MIYWQSSHESVGSQVFSVVKELTPPLLISEPALNSAKVAHRINTLSGSLIFEEY